MKKEFYCIKDIYEYKKGDIYQYRDEDGFSIYVYYHSYTLGRIGTKFSMIDEPGYNWLDYYKLYFCTLSEMRKFKLEKLKSVK